MNIPFIDLGKQYRLHQTQLDKAVSNVLSHGAYIMGPEVAELEKQLADYVGVKHVLACSSGTDALVLPLMQKNLSKNDAIFIPTFTFFASAESISLAGATPVFVDIDPETYNIDCEDLEQKIKQIKEQGKLDPKGIIAVDLFGLAADYDNINRIAKENGLFVIEDAAQSFAADYKGRKAGSLAPIAATSFYPAKPLGCYGDGGAVFTDDTQIYEELVSLRVHGQANTGDKYDNVRIGLNARMDTIQAAILIEKLAIFDMELEQRNRVANSYCEKLDGILKTPNIPDNQSSVWAQYTVESDQRDKIRNALNEHGIPTAVFYPIPIHLSTAYQHLGYSEGEFANSEHVSQRVFSLPMHPYLEESQIATICEIISAASD